MTSRVDAALARVRKLCLSLPGTTERLSHGAPTFFVGKGKGKSFLNFVDNHHGDGRLAVIVAAPTGAQAALVEANPECYFLPPYVAGMGWIGVRLDRDLPWPEVASVIESAYSTVAARARL